ATPPAGSSGVAGRAPRRGGGGAARLGARRPRATPAQVAAALVARAAQGRVSDRGAGSPDRILQVPPG
ncbi:S8 family peptidase, partial [Streptomyces sp. NPDC059378]